MGGLKMEDDNRIQFHLETDTDGNLYAVLPDGLKVLPKFEFDQETGDVFMVTDH